MPQVIIELPKSVQLNQRLIQAILEGDYPLLKCLAREVGLSERTCRNKIVEFYGMTYKEMIGFCTLKRQSGNENVGGENPQCTRRQ